MQPHPVKKAAATLTDAMNCICSSPASHAVTDVQGLQEKPNFNNTLFRGNHFCLLLLTLCYAKVLQTDFTSFVLQGI